MNERVSVSDAAKELGCAAQAVRERMKRGIWDLGEVIEPCNMSGKHYCYNIYRPKLDRLLGKEVRS